MMALAYRLLTACLLSAMAYGVVGVVGSPSSLADESTPVPVVSRVEVVLANEYRNQVAALKEEFAQAGMPNVHFQFAKRGQPPQNIGVGRDVPADKAREAIRLALKYNLGVGILLPERLFPPRFITIASSNYDDTVEYPIDRGALAKLQNPDLTTEEFHRLYKEFTSVTLVPKGRY
ncbi:MAG: hypothetical protein HP497_10160 [Nitrospira sp.]|nr:hypothetical protein [Nitrospira sp.]